MKKVLIFGLGRQGDKYISFFGKKGFTIHGVSRLNQRKIHGTNKQFTFTDIEEKFSQHDLNLYTYIIVAVAPLSQQEKVVTYLSEKHLHSDIIIEKPIVRTIQQLKHLVHKKEFSFFIDEVGIKKLPIGEIEHIDIFGKNYDTFDHAIGYFLSGNSFENIQINISHKEYPVDGLYYKIYINRGEYIIEYKNTGEIFLNGHPIDTLSFSSSLDYYLKITEKEKLLIKKNFLKYVTHVYN